VEKSAFTYPIYSQMHAVLEAAFLLMDPTAASASDWSNLILEMADEALRPKFSAALVDPLNVRAEDSIERYVTGVLAKLLELDASRQVVELKSKLLLVDSEQDPAQADELTRALFQLESQRRALLDQARGVI
jgi:DNA primase